MRSRILINDIILSIMFKYIIYSLCLLLMNSSCSDNSVTNSPFEPDDTKEDNHTELSISRVSVLKGYLGEEVVIYGSGFSEIKDENTVKFAGSEVDIILRASFTELKTRIPEGSETGTISVEVNGTTATSDFRFDIMSITSPSNPVEVQESDFYTETIGQVDTTVNLVDDYGADGTDIQDDSDALQAAINEMTTLQNGGRIIIPSGTFYFRDILLKSNVHLEIDPAATIKPAEPDHDRNYAIFHFGSLNGASGIEHIQNVSIRPGGHGRFAVDLQNLSNPKVRVVRLVNVQNFLIGGFNVKDDNTKYNSLALTVVINKGEFSAPTDGVVKNISVVNAHHGYGLVQVQLAYHVLFKNLHSEGGSTLRLESGWEQLSRLHPRGMDEIYGRNISNKNGYNAVLMAPH